MEAPNNTPVSSVPPAPAPVTPKAPLSRRTAITLGVVVVIIVALIAVLLQPAVRSWFSSLFGVSLEERSVLLEGMTDEGTHTFLKLSGDAVQPFSLPATLSDYSERNGVRVGINGTTDIVKVEGSAAETLYTDGEYKSAVAVSPDGTMVAFASMVPGATGPDIGRWYVKLLSMSDKSLTIVGVGYAPQFMLRDGKSYLLFTSPDGIAVFDPSVGTISITPITVEGSTDYTVAVSDDGSYLAIRDALIGQYFVYRVTSLTDRLGFSSVRALPQGTVSATFRYGKMYAVTQGENGQELLVFETPDAAEAASRYQLPPAVPPYKLLP